MIHRTTLRKCHVRAVLKSRSGTTLLECLIALVMFTAVMMMASTMLSSAGILSNRAKDLEDSVNVVVNKAEIADGTTSGSSTTLTFSGGTTSVSVDVQEMEIVSDDTDPANAVKVWRFNPVLPPSPVTPP